MTTGDIRNNLKKLQKEVSAIRYPSEMDYEGLTKGDVLAHLPLLYHLFFHYSPNVVENVSKLNYNLAGKKDSDFMNVVFKIIRELNPSYHLTLKVKQFMTKGYVEHKIIMTMNIIRFIRNCPKLTLCKGKPRKKGAMSATSDYHATYTTSNVPHAVESAATAVLSANSHSVNSNYKEKVSPLNETAPRPSVVRHLDTRFHHINDSDATPQANHLETNTSESSIETNPSVANNIKSVTQLDEEPGQNSENLNDEDDVYSLVLEISDDLMKMKEMMEKSNQELNVEITELKSKLDSSKKCSAAENEKLKSKVNDLEQKVSELQEELTAEKAKQAERPDFESVLARLDIMDSKFKSLEHSHKTTNERIPLSPVCGNNLCSHMKNLNIPAEESVLDSNNADDCSDNSSLDGSIETPCRQQIRQRSAKLIELVQGTRSLLGIDQDMSENLFLAKNSENVPPELNS